MGNCEDCKCSPEQQCSDPGDKHDGGKARVDLVDPLLMLSAANGLEFGLKYGEHNWRKGMQWHRIYGGLLRHLYAFWQGENYDPESGNHHLDHAACMLMFLIRYAKDDNYAEFDDRYKQVNKGGMFEEMILDEVELGEVDLKPGGVIYFKEDPATFDISNPCPTCVYSVQGQCCYAGDCVAFDEDMALEQDLQTVANKSFTCLTCTRFATPPDQAICVSCVHNGQNHGSIDYYTDQRQISALAGKEPELHKCYKDLYENGQPVGIYKCPCPDCGKERFRNEM